MKLSNILPLFEAVLPSIESNPDLMKLATINAKLANDLQVAWQGDARDYQRTPDGKNFQSLVVQMLNARVLERKYGIQITPEVNSSVQRLSALAHQTFIDRTKLRAASNAGATGGIWGNSWARESVAVDFDNGLYENLKQEITALLSE